MSVQDTLTLDRRTPAISRDEGIALVVALAAHAALVAALTLGAPGREIQPPPERMTVTFADQVADQSTSPDPFAQAAPDEAPMIGEVPPEPAPQLAPAPAPQIQPRLVQPAPSRIAPRVAPPQPRQPPPKAAPKPPQDMRDRRRPDAPVGGSRIGNDFLKGVPTGPAPGTSRSQPAATIGPAERASLAGAIARQLKPRWTAPQGADADKLITILTWDMNPDGSLAGAPRVVRQEGITDANRAQAPRHAEQAIRAVRLAAPFDLPANLYNGWKRVGQFRFDRKLSQ